MLQGKSGNFIAKFKGENLFRLDLTLSDQYFYKKGKMCHNLSNSFADADSRQENQIDLYLHKNNLPQSKMHLIINVYVNDY